MTIQDFQELQEIEHFSPLEKAIHTVAILDKKSIDEVELESVANVFKRFNDLMSFDISKKFNPKKSTFYHKGKFYRLFTDATQIEANHFIMLQNFTDIINNLHKIMAILSQRVNFFGKPIKSSNIAIEFEQKCEDFKSLDFEFANNYSIFFLNLYPELLNVTQIYLKEMIEKVQANRL